MTRMWKSHQIKIVLIRQQIPELENVLVAICDKD